jgi:hypothetical protein
MPGFIFKGGLGMLLMSVSVSVLAQSSNSILPRRDSAVHTKPVVKPLIKKPKPIRTEMSLGAKLNTNGWGGYLNKGWVKSEDSKYSDQFYNLRYVELEFDEVKNPKEVRSTNQYLAAYSNEKPKPYIYGKINNFYTVKIGYGFRRMIAGKPEPRSVSVHWFYLGGLSIGLLKPYYIDANVPQDNGGQLIRETIKYGDDTKEAFLNDRLVIGSAGFMKGLGEIKIVPGAHLKTGLHFDFAASKKTVLAIEAGVAADFYTQKIEIMANQTAYPYNFNVFMAYQFGKRW